MSSASGGAPLSSKIEPTNANASTTLHVGALLLLLVGSILPGLIYPGVTGQIVKLVSLLVAVIVSLLVPRWRSLTRFAVVLLVINLAFLSSTALRDTSWWSQQFQWAGFFAPIAAIVASKLVGIVPVAVALLLLLRSASQAYLLPGDLAQKAEAIPWLGIRGGVHAWGRLSLIAGPLIALGTILLALITTTGFGVPKGIGLLLPSLPLILLLAVVNSFCEGLVYRSAIMAPLRNVFAKSFVVLMPAIFFGIAHYQGVPGGLLGGAMSGVLGYFLARSVYETNGFAAAWYIHFVQDVAIFATLVLLA